MKKQIFAALLALASFQAFAQVQIEANQTCKGIGQNDEVVSTKLFLTTSEDKNVFDAQLEIEVNGKQKMTLGTLTKKSDLMGARMFKNNDDSIRYF